MIPKKEVDDRITKQRPLKLQETLRKVTVCVQRKRMVRVWRRLGLLSTDQYAFVNKGGTTEPALMKRMLIEDALFHGKNLGLRTTAMARRRQCAFRHEQSCRGSGPLPGAARGKVSPRQRRLVHADKGSWQQSAGCQRSAGFFGHYV